MRYAVVTPVRNEAATLPPLSASLAGQTVAPAKWIVVENGSTDDTPEVAAGLARSLGWVDVVTVTAGQSEERAPSIVTALNGGLDAVDGALEVVAKVDADVTLPPDYFERLLAELERDPSLGVVSGTCHEQQGEAWQPRFVTGSSVWGAARAYRRECLEQLRPHEPRTAWDWIDVTEANVLGWSSRVLTDVPFYHHRREGDRAPNRWAQWSAQGRAAHYLRYRPTYVVLRGLYHAVRDPSAVALVTAYAGAAVRRSPTSSKPALVAFVRDQQRLRNVGRRAAEARGVRKD